MQAKQLAERLSEWLQQGLISEEQRQRIAAYEDARGAAGKSRPWVLYGLLMLGAMVVGIGVISLIAANWEEIPGAVKLGGTFAVLIALAWGTYRASEREKQLWFHLMAVLLSMGVLGAIGVVAQVFHTGGELFLALLFWLLTIAPLAILCRRGALPHLWVAVSLVTLVAWLTADRWWRALSVDLDHDLVIAALLLGLPLLCLLASNVTARPALQGFGRGYGLWAHVGALVGIGTVDFFWSVDHPDFEPAWLAGLAVVATLAALTLWLRQDVPAKGRLAVAALVALAVLAVVPFGFDLGGGHHGYHRDALWQVIGASFTVVALLLLAALFAARDARRAFNGMTILVGVRLLVVYMQVIGSLAMTGVGLVVSGLVIIGVALLWFKTRARVQAFFGGLVR
jgi:hypothetical protein